MLAVPFQAVTVLAPSVKIDPRGAPLTVTLEIDSDPSASVRLTPTVRGIWESSVPEASAVDTTGASASATMTMVCVAGSADHASPSETLNSSVVVPL